MAFVCFWIFLDMMNSGVVLAGEILARVRSNKVVRCGVTEPLAGFSFKDENGQWHGLNIDFCRAVAVAALNDSEKVTLTPLSSPQRFPSSCRKLIYCYTTTWTLHQTGQDTISRVYFMPEALWFQLKKIKK
jgi:general L-amino acid transport system substrate-binding protein